MEKARHMGAETGAVQVFEVPEMESMKEVLQVGVESPGLRTNLPGRVTLCVQVTEVYVVASGHG